MTGSGKSAPAVRPAASGEAAISSIEAIIDDFRRGKMVIMVDDEDRENEGDLLIAAECVRPEDINFMARNGRGLVCLTLTEERCRRLKLPLMVRDNNAHYSTNFTVSIEAATGVTTGISAADRTTTVHAAVRPDARPEDLVAPGHVFPVMAQPGGVLTRAGHTEAGVDLARLAGFEPASVICEVLSEDGSMARLADLVAFGRLHGIKIGAIADLIRYRLEHEPTVKRIAESELATDCGSFRLLAYRDEVDGGTHFALVLGAVTRDVPTRVRVHAYSGLFDAFAEVRSQQPWSIGRAVRAIAAHGAGVLVILRHDEDADAFLDRVRRTQMHDMGIESADDSLSTDLRMLGVGSQILADLGVGKMRVLGAPRKAHGLSGFGLEIVDYIEAQDA